MELIKLLIELADKEKKYKEWYEAQDLELRSVARVNNNYNDYYDFKRENRSPNNANIKDAMRIVARLSFQMARR